MEQNQSTISFDELIRLQNDDCVQVSKGYFQSLLIMTKYMKNIDQKILEIFRKYIETENMYSIIFGKNVNTDYYLMSVEDVKFLITSINFEQYSSTTFLKSDIKVDDLNKKHEKLKELFKEKRNKDNNHVLKMKKDNESK